MPFKSVRAWPLALLTVLLTHSPSYASDTWKISHHVPSGELPRAPRILSILLFDQQDAAAPFEVRHLEAEQWRLEVDLSEWPFPDDRVIPIRADLRDMQAYKGTQLWAEMQLDGEAVGERFLLEVVPGVGLKVEGPIESGAGGFVFPDQSIQLTAIGGTDTVTADAIAPGAVGTSELASGAVTAAKIDANEVQRRVTGTCTAGSSIRTIDSTGAVQCEPDDAPAWEVNGSNVYYLGGNVGIGTSNPAESLSVSGNILGANFNVSGTGKAGVLDAQNAYHLDGARVLDTGASNSLFVGTSAGLNSTGASNTFVGVFAGASNQSGQQNTLVGSQAGAQVTIGNGNSFFGQFSGQTVTTGGSNSFFGRSAGNGGNGSNNSYFGFSAGAWSNSGTNNTAIGANAGANPVGDGSFNTLLGANTSSGGSMNYATALGAGVAAWKSNSVQIGRPEDDVRVSGDLFLQGGLVQITTGGLAIGGIAPSHKLDIAANGGNIIMGDAGCPSGSTAIGFGNGFGNCERYYLRGSTASNDLWINRPTGGAIRFREGNGTTSQIILEPGGKTRFAFPVILAALGSAGSTALCRNASNEISTCSSSIRYKSGVKDFDAGYEVVEKLRPVSFRWTASGEEDLGFVAEEVETVAPMLVSYGEGGRVEGVKYDRFSALLVNVVKEQQAEIRMQREQIDDLGRLALQLSDDIRELRALLCERMAESPQCAAN